MGRQGIYAMQDFFTTIHCPLGVAFNLLRLDIDRCPAAIPAEGQPASHDHQQNDYD